MLDRGNSTETTRETPDKASPAEAGLLRRIFAEPADLAVPLLLGLIVLGGGAVWLMGPAALIAIFLALAAGMMALLVIGTKGG